MSKDALPQQSLSALYSHSFEQFKAEQQTSQHVVFSTGNFNDFFLPPLDAALKLLGVKNPTLFGIESAEKHLKLPLNIKPSSRHKLTKEGVGLPSATKLIEWVTELVLQVITKDAVFSEKQLIESMLVNSNAAGWYFGVNNAVQMKQANSTDEFTAFTPLLKFITQRCRADLDCLNLAKCRIEEYGLEGLSLADMLAIQAPFWLANSEIDNATWECYCEVLLQSQAQTIRDKQTELAVFRCFAEMQFDFYLAAIASYEVGHTLSASTDIEVVTKPNGLLTRGILFYTDGIAKNCFDGFLHELKRVYGIQLGEVNWRWMASFIDIEGESSDEIEEQYDRLKKWRSGKGSISNKKLLHFFQNLVGTDDMDSLLLLNEYARIALGLDRQITLFKQQYKVAESTTVELDKILKQVLAQYPNYYLRCVERELLLIKKRQPV
ncbi:hypothetical protein MSG37_19975 [Shewanella sp. 1CM18E]|uniref:hypothetical protein n=1 Tax=Shewanella sp. 1CM18E TaxID=2929169 RepID=UPI0020BF66FD|nr:hypothetical protein [Shewanella sp. 1CM18E]MCK8047169.1 hypothetical protein [Shewanella sp. 1CM18E]